MQTLPEPLEIAPVTTPAGVAVPAMASPARAAGRHELPGLTRTVLPTIENALPASNVAAPPAWKVADDPASTERVVPAWAERPSPLRSVRFLTL